MNLPVKDLPTSIDFFTSLGFAFDRRLTDDNAGGLVISDDSSAMLAVEPFFTTFTRSRSPTPPGPPKSSLR